MRGWWLALMIVGVVFLAQGSSSPLPWIFFFFFVLPMLTRLINSVTAPQEEAYKRKRMGEDVIIVDKPKREPRYAVGDDGELVEVYEESAYEEKPKRRQSNGDDMEYV